MPRPFDEDDDFHGETWEEDDDDLVDDDDEEEEDTRVCAKCKSGIFGDSVRCPRCGFWLEDEHQEYERKPWWMIILAALLLFVFAYWILNGI